MSLSLLTDFPDRLSPMLVKELRQGLRAKTFIAVFLSLQAALALILFSASAAASTSSAGGVISNVIFIFFAIAVIVVQPMRGIGAISSEIKSNTIDMMVLTKLSASRIVFGKWFAIVSQSGLLLATIIPYLILRYFFGGMNLVGEVVLLFLLFLTSMALTAITVGLSGSSSIILRALMPIFGLPILAWTFIFAMFASGSSNGLIELCSLNDNDAKLAVTIYIIAITYLGWAILSLGSSMIAPAAENHSTFRRAIMLMIAIFGAAAMFIPGFDIDALWLLFTVIALPAIGTALTERSMLVASVREPFERRGILGELASFFFAPGWATGVFFTLLITGILVGSALINCIDSYFRFGEFTVVLSILGALLFPAVILILCRTDEAARVSNYLLLLVGSGIFVMIMYAVSESLSNKNMLWFFIWNPLTMAVMSAEGYGEKPLLTAAIVVNVTYLLLLVGAAIILMKRQREERRLAAESV